MHVKLPAALTLFSLLTTSAIAVPAANVERNNDGHPTTTTTSACAATSSAAVGGGVSGLLNDILTVGLAGTRPFLVYPPFGKHALIVPTFDHRLDAGTYAPL
jgi:hypothetical protein